MAKRRMCVVCNKEFEINGRSRATYCSVECKGATARRVWERERQKGGEGEWVGRKEKDERGRE